MKVGFYMAYIVKYIKDFNNKTLIEKCCEKDLQLGYKIKVFAHTDNFCDIQLENVTFNFCDNPTETAILETKKLYAEKCQFYVKRSVYSVDPSIYPEAIKIKEMDYETAQELLVIGYNEVSYEDIDLAKRNSVRVEILSLADYDGTTIKEVVAMDEKIIKSMSKDTDISVVTLTEIPDKMGVTYNIFKALSDADVYVDSIMLSPANNGQQDISFCIKKENCSKVENLLTEKQADIGFTSMLVSDNVAKISIMCAGFNMQSGIATKVLEVLYQNNINIMMIFTSEVKISLVVEKAQADRTIHAIHKNLIANK